MARPSGEGQAVGVSLWLVPEGEVHGRLATLIESLARRLGTPSFAPHVTLLGGILDAEAEVLTRATELTRGLAPLVIPLERIDGSDDYFRCLFVRAGETEALLAAHERAGRAFGRGQAAPFLPHLSLVYGRLAPGGKQRLIAELKVSLPAEFRATRLEVVRTEGPPEDWLRLRALSVAG